MTKEQIKALFEAGPLCCGNHEHAVARLLEERKRLLEALRPFAEPAQAGTFGAILLRAGADRLLEEHISAWDAVVFAEANAEDAAEPQ